MGKNKIKNRSEAVCDKKDQRTRKKHCNRVHLFPFVDSEEFCSTFILHL